MAGYRLVFLGDEQFPHVPLFTLNNGIAISFEGNQSNVFGKVDGFNAFGNAELVRPFQIQLENDSKVVNFSTHLCIGPQSFLPKMIVSSTTNTAGMKCSLQDVYFFSPAEVKHLESVYKAKVKMNETNPAVGDTPEDYTREENTPEDTLEQYDLEKSSFGDADIYYPEVN